MGKSRANQSTIKSEVRFWACFAVIFALFSQVLFPAQVMARSTADGVQLILCSDGIGAQPVADIVSAKLLKSQKYKTDGHQGLKCASCVLASITAISPPIAPVVPAVYSSAQIDRGPSAETAPVKARAPPRPHSCGPPSQI